MNIFGTPIQRSFIIDEGLSRAIGNSGILSFLEDNKVWNCSVETSYFNDEQKSALDGLKEAMNSYILPFAVNYIRPFVSTDFEVSFQHTWVNRYTPGKFQERHAHPGSEVSFVYMHKTTENHSSLRFHNSNNSHLEEILKRTGVDFESLIVDIFLAPREIVFFPSYLMHSVVPHNANGERITFSGNIKVRAVEK